MQTLNTLLKRSLGILLLLCAVQLGFAQDNERIEALQQSLDRWSRDIPGLNHSSDLALSDVPLSDYVRALGKVHQVNVYIDDTPDLLITNNFVNEPVKSIFLFLCKKFDLTIESVGTILNFKPYVAPKEPLPVVERKALKIDFQAQDSLLSFDLDNDSLARVIKEVSRLTGRTILLKPNLQGQLSGYIPPTAYASALENILFSNGFSLTPHRKGFYIVDSYGVGNGGRPGRNNGNQAVPPQGPVVYDLSTVLDTAGQPLIFLQAENQDLNRIVRDLFAEVDMEYFMFDDLQGNATLNVQGLPLEEVLQNLLRGTEFAYKRDQQMFLIGKRDMEGLRQVSIVNLRYRPTEKVIELMPEQLKEGVELKEFVELNRIIVSGGSEQIREIRRFIEEIDRPVPMVKIEMVAVDVDFNRLLRTSVKAGLLQPGDSLGAVKSLFPGLDYGLDGNALNGILAASGIPALANVGTLRSNFYVQLQAQESRGLLKVVTRPVISTLNGNEASITIGQTDYYRLETNTAANSAVNSFNQISQRFETIEINTTIKVKPLVSHDGMVTLELSPDFTSPGAQADPNIPPTILTRSFQSIIRVKDGETVVLGGLSRESSSTSTDGLPLISRIPVLKWLFGENARNKAKSSLIIYITPTIYYN